MKGLAVLGILAGLALLAFLWIAFKANSVAEDEYEWGNKDDESDS